MAIGAQIVLLQSIHVQEKNCEMATEMLIRIYILYDTRMVNWLKENYYGMHVWAIGSVNNLNVRRKKCVNRTIEVLIIMVRNSVFCGHKFAAIICKLCFIYYVRCVYCFIFVYARRDFSREKNMSSDAILLLDTSLVLKFD